VRHVRKKQTADQHTQRRAREALQTLFAYQADVLLAYIHGSFARGEPFRDLDVAALVADRDRDGFLARELRLEAAVEDALRRVEFTSPVDLRTLNRAPVSFSYQVIRTGFPVFVRDDGVRVDFETRTVSRYLDFARFRREQLREVLGVAV